MLYSHSSFTILKAWFLKTSNSFQKHTYPVGLLRAGEGAGLLRALGNTGVTGGVKNSSSSSLPRASLTKLKSNVSEVCAEVGVVSLAVDVTCITVTFSSCGVDRG